MKRFKAARFVKETATQDIEKKKERESRPFPRRRLLRGVRRFETDVSGLPIGSIFKGQAVRVEVSVSNHITSRNNPEDGRLQFKSGGSVRSCKQTKEKSYLC
jgi:hypothetical protein